MHVLGLTAFDRDAAAALVRDGELIAFAVEQRFTHNPHESAFPRGAVRHCLERAGIEPRDLDALVLSEKPSRCFERLLANDLTRFPRTWLSCPRLLASWLGDRLWARGRLAEEVGVPSTRVLFVESQRARAAWTFFASRCDEAAILVSDEPREWAATTLARGSGRDIELLREVHAPHSLARFGAEAARHLGLSGLEHLAQLSELGTPNRRARLENVLAIAPDGSHAIALEMLFDALGVPRAAGAPFERRNASQADADAAASVMCALGDALVAAARALQRETGCADLCFGGELASLSPLASRLLADGAFARVWIPPAPGGAGAAAGAAHLVAAVLGAPRQLGLEHRTLDTDERDSSRAMRTELAARMQP